MIPVIYIVGAGRSGSTILAHLLGELDGYVSVGELRNLWISAVLQRSLCSCGSTIVDCPFWSPIVEDLRLDDRVEAEAVTNWQKRHLSAARPTNLMLTRTDSKKRKDPGLNRYADGLRDLYAAVARRSGAKVIVDSSKGPIDAAVLGAVEGIVPYYVHLVRDPRAVIYSWSRQKAADPQGDRLFSRRGTLKATATWVAHNAETEVVRAMTRHRRWQLLRYEDLVAHPARYIGAIQEMIESVPDERPAAGRSAVLHTQHSLGGNPVRFQTGRVEIRSDDEWRTKLAPRKRALVKAAAFPLLRRYRY